MYLPYIHAGTVKTYCSQGESHYSGKKFPNVEEAPLHHKIINKHGPHNLYITYCWKLRRSNLKFSRFNALRFLFLHSSIIFKVARISTKIEGIKDPKQAKLQQT
jgi:hypothetical protein